MRRVDDEHVGPFDELLENLLSTRGFQIERDAALVAVGQVPGIRILRLRLRWNLVSYPPEVAGRGLDFDDVGAEVGQDHRSAWARDETREIHHFQSGENVVACHWCLLDHHKRDFFSARGTGGRAFRGRRTCLLSYLRSPRKGR